MQDRGLGSVDLEALIRICWRAGKNPKNKAYEGMCWEKQDDMADQRIRHMSTVGRALEELEHEQLVIAIPRFGASTIYIPVCNLANYCREQQLAGTSNCRTVRHPLKELY